MNFTRRTESKKHDPKEPPIRPAILSPILGLILGLLLNPRITFTTINYTLNPNTNRALNHTLNPNTNLTLNRTLNHTHSPLNPTHSPSLNFTIGPTPSYATTFYPQPFPKDVEEAPNIVRGHIGMSYPDWGKDEFGTKRIYTYYELQISEVFKSNSSNSSNSTGTPLGTSLIMRELGGQKDGIGMEVAGASQYQKGEDVIVFLNDKGRDGAYDVRGLMMGKFNIQTDADGNEYLEGPALAADVRNSPDVRNSNDPRGAKKWTLDALRKLIRDQSAHTAHPTQTASPSPRSTNLLQTHGASPTPSAPTLSAPPAASPSPLITALQLQPQTDGSHTKVSLWVSLMLTIVSGGLGFILLNKNRKQK